MEIPISTIQTLVTVVIGALIGFLGSMGLESWKRRNQCAELKLRIKRELLFIQKQIQTASDNKDFQPRAFFIDIYSALIKDIIRQLPMKISGSIRMTYMKIEEIRYSSNIPDAQAKKYSEAPEHINQTLELALTLALRKTLIKKKMCGKIICCSPDY